MTDHDTPTILRTQGITSPRAFDLAPDAVARAALAQDLGISAIRKLGFRGSVAPDGDDDLVLEAHLGATVVQPCVLTLDPVTTRIDETVTRRYLAHMPDLPEGDEIEMPEDDTAEPLPRTIDLLNVMAEALALALPAFPRADGVEPIDVSVTEPGKTPMTDDEAKPFAGLKSLRDRLGGTEDEDD